MDPITLVLRGDKLPAFPDPAGSITLAEHDANLAALKTAAEQPATKRELDALRQRVRTESQAAKRMARPCNKPSKRLQPKAGEVWP